MTREITYSSDKWRDQRHTSFGAGDSLTEAKEKGEVAVNTLVALELSSSLDTLPGRRDLDKHTFFLDSNGFVEPNELSGLGFGGLLVKGEASVDFSRDTTRNDRRNFFPKFYELYFIVSVYVEKSIFRMRERTRRSVAASTCSSTVRPFSLPYLIATS